MRVDPRAEVEILLGNPAKTRKKLGWTSKISFEGLVAEMLSEDLKSAEKDVLIKQLGYKADDYKGIDWLKKVF